MKRSRLPIGSIVVLGLALITGGWFLQHGLAQGQNAGAQPRLFQEIVDHISNRYVDEVDRDSLYRHAIDGVLRDLGDPNTSLLDVSAYENFRIQTEGDYGGVGLEIVDRDEYITVVSPLPGTPGARAGIRAGDLIVEVEGNSTQDWSVQQAVQVLRGRPGTAVEVLIRRPGIEAPIEFSLTREQIELTSIPFAALLDGGVGYIPLGLFSDGSTREVQNAADSLVNEGARALVLDLRGNPGGVLDQGVGVADLFLPRATDVVETRGRGGRSEGMLRSGSDDQYQGVPVVVLVDRGSASASEIVAGALQDHDRALLIGGSTFGKGSVQTLFSLSGGNVLKLTTARWYTPQGRSIERVGEDTADFDADEEEAPSSLALTVTGQYELPADTAGRPTVTSVGGRTLYGGGGIVPDLLVTMEVLSPEEQDAVRVLFQSAGQYSTGVFNYAVAYLQRNAGAGPDFVITSANLDEFYALLQDRGVSLDRADFDAAERFVRYHLESEIAQQGWGALAEFERTLPHDPPLQKALELLREVESPEALFVRAQLESGRSSDENVAVESVR